MTRKDFRIIAEIIRTMPVDSHAKRTCAVAFADTLKNTNMTFKRDTFLLACGVI